MSNRYNFGRDYHLIPENVRYMQTRTLVNLINGHPEGLGFAYNPFAGHYGLDFYGGESSDDDEEHRPMSYCGFVKNFLEKGSSHKLNEISYRTTKSITAEEAAKNAKALVDEEEKLKKKAEKKKQKKMRQRERRRLEKLEKENANKDSGQKTDSDLIKLKPEENCDEKNKTDNTAPSNIKPPCNTVTPENSDSCDEEEDDDEECIAGKQEELDMNSCFVTNAAAIAKRKLEQKPKSDREKRSEKSKKNGQEQRKTADHQYKDKNDKEAVSSEKWTDPVTKSMEFAVIGNTYATTGDLDKAVDNFTQAIKHNPQEFKLFGNRSFCYERMQQFDKALRDADLALSLNPTWIKGLYRKGKALVGLKRFCEAISIYEDVLKLDPSCTDAKQELLNVKIMQLMDMGYTREQSTNALIIHGTVEKALDALSELHGNLASTNVPCPVPVKEDEFLPVKASRPLKVPLKPVPQNQPRVRTSSVPALLELFPIWVGDLVPALSEFRLLELFNIIGPVHSVKLLSARRCAFINYTRKEDCEKAIREMHGYNIAGTRLVVRYPDRIHTHLGVSKSASTDTWKTDKLPDECIFWRTTGCVKNNRCSYRHIPENKGVDAAKGKR